MPAVIASAPARPPVTHPTKVAKMTRGAGSGSLIELGSAGTVTMTGTLAFTIFAIASDYAILRVYGTTYSGGTITGSRYSADAGKINTFGGGASFFPGNSAGSTANNGMYA